jgi:D-tyrosyl-tRNA(Tyr) deacylase
MRAVVQRVSRASVTVNDVVVGSIGTGLLVFVGFTSGDTTEQADWVAAKIAGMRVFPDDDDKMNRSLLEADGAALVVSQFTLYGDVRKGRRPSFVRAAPPDEAIPLYEYFIEALRRCGVHTASGEFGAMMDVALVNAGPVTITIER